MFTPAVIVTGTGKITTWLRQVGTSTSTPPIIKVSQCPIIPLSQCPGVPVFQCPNILGSQFPSVPPDVSVFKFPSVPVSHCPYVPMSQCPGVPITWGYREAHNFRDTRTHTRTEVHIEGVPT